MSAPVNEIATPAHGREPDGARAAVSHGAGDSAIAFAASHVALKYRPDIDGLRAVAVLAVVAFHAFPDLLPGGFVGVDIFFVISGYLISGIILQQIAAQTFTIGDFYARRIRRIFPSLVVVLLACLAAGWYLLLPQEFSELGKHIAAGAGFSSNVVLWQESGYFDVSSDTKPLLHLWSLGVEEQFYFFWPAVLYVAWKRRWNMLATTLVLLAASFVLNLVFIGIKPVATFYLPVTRTWELLIGAGLACAMRSGTLATPHGVRADATAALGVACIVAAVALLDKYAVFPGWWALLPTIGAGLLIAAGPHNLVARHLLSRRAMVWFGLISFPLYLWHWPLLAFARIVEGGLPPAGVRAAAALASIVLAWLSFEFVEKKLRFRAGAQRPLFAAVVVLLVVGLGMRWHVLEPRHSGAQINAVAAAVADWRYPPANFSRLEVQGERFYERAGGAPGRVVFIGDSITEQYAVRVDRLLTEQPQRTRTTVFAATGGCPPIPGVVLDRAKECQPRLAAATSRALADDVDTVVVGACWYCYFHAEGPVSPADEYHEIRRAHV